MTEVTTLPRFHAREMVPYQPRELWENITGDFILIFDDGEELQTNAIMTFFSSYAWSFHRKFYNTPLLARHHVQKVLNGRRLSSNTHLDLFGNALWDTYDTYLADVDRDDLAEVLFIAMSDIYNDWTYIFEEYVASMDIVDFAEIMYDPEIVKSREETVAEPWSIKAAYKVLNKVLSDPTKLQNNPVALAYQSKLVNANQLQQCIGPRGYITDTDSTQFRYPVMRGYVEGIRDMYGSIVESRSASKALQFSKANLRDAEYFSRKLQLACMAVKNLHEGDCGSQEYLPWTVRGASYNEEGEQIAPSELPLLEGQFYLDADTNTLKIVRSNDTHLIGTTINMRNVIYCAHPDPDGICATCFGELSLSVPKRSNIGHLCCVTMTEPSTQSVLSVKHLDGNATIESVAVDVDHQRFLKASKDRQAYLFQEKVSHQHPRLRIAFKDAPNLNDIMGAREVEDFNISRISELEVVQLVVNDGKHEETHSLRVHMGRRKSSMSYALLNHIKRKNWELDTNGNYVIDMQGFNFSDPAFVLPLRHFNMSDHSKEISSLLQATKDQMQQRDKKVQPSAFLVEFFNLVNNKLQVNIAPLSVILRAIMIVSAEQEDYRLPKPWTTKGIGVHDLTMARRSLSATMAYQDHYDIFISPESFVRGNRPDHIFDGLVTPYELYGELDWN